ncbi:MAG: HAMP domain-containing sensor histidine kinase [Flavobacteriales bacterium]
MIRKGFVKYLVVLMSISLIGIILMHFYLLKQTLNTSEEIFSRNVIKALTEATERLRKQERILYFKKFQDFFGSMKKKTLKKNFDFKGEVIDSVTQKKYVYRQGYTIEDIYTPILQLDDKIKGILNIVNLRYYRGGFKESLKKEKEDIEKIPKYLSRSKATSIEKRAFILDRYIMIISNETPIGKRIRPESIEVVLDAEFKNQNIKPRYEFAVLNKDRRPTPTRSKGYEEQEGKYEQELYLDEKYQPTYFLSVYFPRKNITIFNSIFGIVILSVIVIFVILGVYAASLFYMDRQKKISEMKNDFINNMTHEFKTHIATINVVTDILKNSIVNTPQKKVEQYAALIKDENARMDNQIEMVLRMSKLDYNQLELDFKAVNINDLVSKTVERIRLVVEKRQGKISETYHASSVQIHVDPIHFESAILNILDNANKYSLDPPEINVRAFIKEESVFIQIQDKGIGMSRQVQQKIFERFFRAEGGNSHNVRGHGLGLPYVKKIVDLHKAAIFVESERGKGSKFTIQVSLNN